MRRNCSLEEISDGKLYKSNDMVRANCMDCKGCSDCCQGMGNSIVLDPLDIHRFMLHFKQNFQEFLEQGFIELNVVDGLILPNLKMAGDREVCIFLDGNGRCSIHAVRPGICRLFPLGRYYENHDFFYFLQVHECKMPNKAKIKVHKWIDTPELQKNEQFVVRWHYLLNAVEQMVKNMTDEAAAKQLDMTMLQYFFINPYTEGMFYEEFAKREQAFRNAFELLD